MDHQAAKALNDLELMLLDETAEPRALPLSLLQDITNGFSADREIGKGGFAVVYRVRQLATAQMISELDMMLRTNACFYCREYLGMVPSL
jgi:hypothetical protein